jgi:hypothetical protein
MRYLVPLSLCGVLLGFVCLLAASPSLPACHVQEVATALPTPVASQQLVVNKAPVAQPPVEPTAKKKETPTTVCDCMAGEVCICGTDCSCFQDATYAQLVTQAHQQNKPLLVWVGTPPPQEVVDLAPEVIQYQVSAFPEARAPAVVVGYWQDGQFLRADFAIGPHAAWPVVGELRTFVRGLRQSAGAAVRLPGRILEHTGSILAGHCQH